MLDKLSKNEDFINNVKKACEKNQIRIKDVQRCMGGLYHNASKYFHGHKNLVVIDSRSWSDNEVFMLGLILNYYKIPFTYRDGQGVKVVYPYDLSGLKSVN
jgi:hypothetical protein